MSEQHDEAAISFHEWFKNHYRTASIKGAFAAGFAAGRAVQVKDDLAVVEAVKVQIQASTPWTEPACDEIARWIAEGVKEPTK